MKIDINNPYQYHRSCLSKKQQAVYTEILTGLTEFNERIKITPSSPADIEKIVSCVIEDNPLIFYARGSADTVISGGNVIEIRPVYNMPRQKAKQHKVDIIMHMRRFSQAMSKSELEKELFVHDLCLKKIKYDGSAGINAHTVIGPVLENAAVCEGIAMYAKLAFDYLGMKSLQVSGEAMRHADGVVESHAWNIVDLSGKTFHLDITWDLTISGNTFRYDYFNISDNEIKKSHRIFSNAPACITEGEDYYTQNALFFDTPDKLSKFLEGCAKSGIKTFTFKIGFDLKRFDLNAFIMKTAGEKFGRVMTGEYMIYTDSNNCQQVYTVSITQ
jgi:hypothetical protein